MNIVILNDFAYVDGGASKIALSSAKALAKRGHRVILLTAVGPIAPELLQTSNLEVRCLEQHEILNDPKRLRAVVRGIWNRNAAQQASLALKDLSPQDTVVHLHTWTKAHSASAIHVAIEQGFPTVLTLHDYFSVCPTGTFYIYPRQQLCRLDPMSAQCLGTQCDNRNYGHKLWRVGRQWTQSNIGGIPSRLSRFISISDRSEELMAPYLPAGARIHRVDNPVDLPRQVPANVAANEHVCYVGRFSPEKGPVLLAESATDAKVKVIFVGDGAERERIASAAPGAEFTGWLNANAVRSVMCRSRALVLPSLWYETQGMVVAEAAALGVPAVVPSESAARQWVEDGVTGLIFRHGDRRDLADKLRWLKENPEGAAAMGQAAYERYWQAPATMESHCEALERVYRSMVEEERQGGAPNRDRAHRFETQPVP